MTSGLLIFHRSKISWMSTKGGWVCSIPKEIILTLSKHLAKRRVAVFLRSLDSVEGIDFLSLIQLVKSLLMIISTQTNGKRKHFMSGFHQDSIQLMIKKKMKKYMKNLINTFSTINLKNLRKTYYIKHLMRRTSKVRRKANLLNNLCLVSKRTNNPNQISNLVSTRS